MTFALIFGLIPHWDPYGIRWFISTIVVLAFYGIIQRRGRPHVRKEVLKLEPTFAHAETASFVVAKVITIRFIYIGGYSATNFHVAPSTIFQAFTFRSVPMGIVKFSAVLFS